MREAAKGGEDSVWTGPDALLQIWPLSPIEVESAVYRMSVAARAAEAFWGCALADLDQMWTEDPGLRVDLCGHFAPSLSWRWSELIRTFIARGFCHAPIPARAPCRRLTTVKRALNQYLKPALGVPRLYGDVPKPPRKNRAKRFGLIRPCPGCALTKSAAELQKGGWV